GRIRWLEADEEARLMDACGKSANANLAKIVTVALETGLRQAELMGLTWDRVDFSRGVIRLEITKSGKRREVPMRQAVYDALAPLRAEALKALPEPKPELKGRVWPDASFPRKAWETALEASGIDDLHFHDTRHHFASWFVMRGGSLLSLSKILGHARITMTERYAHLAEGHLRAEIEKTATLRVRPSEPEQLQENLNESGVCDPTGQGGVE